MNQAAVARVRALPYDLLDVEARRFEEEDYGRAFKARCVCSVFISMYV